MLVSPGAGQVWDRGPWACWGCPGTGKPGRELEVREVRPRPLLFSGMCVREGCPCPPTSLQRTRSI